MCILTLIVNQHPKFPLILASNRDEANDRETTDAKLEENSKLICGRDLKAGGTWSGFNTENGNFVTLTNVRETIKNGTISRGLLVEQLLKNEIQVEEGTTYDGFNVIYGNLNKTPIELKYLTNKELTENGTHTALTGKLSPSVLSNGIHCLSNSSLDDLRWPKVKYLHQQTEEILKNLSDDCSLEELTEKFGNLMCSRPNLENESLAKVDTPFPEVIESELQKNVFVITPIHRTRSQTLIFVDSENTINYYFRNTEKDTNSSWWKYQQNSKDS